MTELSLPHEDLESRERVQRHTKPRHARRTAMLVATLAACLAIVEMGKDGAQNEALSSQIAASDTWAFYQAKTERKTVVEAEIGLLSALGRPNDPAVAPRIAENRQILDRLETDEKGQGRTQLLARARQYEAAREEALHRLHRIEKAVGALQIAMVLASASIVLETSWLALAGLVLGGFGALAGFVLMALA